jgi:hypothetical protein
MRRWINYRLPQGKPVNADIQETSNKRAKDKNKDIAGHHSPNFVFANNSIIFLTREQEK